MECRDRQDSCGGYLKGAGKRRLASQSAQAENTMGEKATNSVWLPVGDSWGQLDPRPKGGAERNPSNLGAKSALPKAETLTIRPSKDPLLTSVLFI